MERITRATTYFQPEIKISPLITEENNKIINLSYSHHEANELLYSMPKYALKNGVMIDNTLVHSELMMSMARNPRLPEFVSRIKSKQIICNSLN